MYDKVLPHDESLTANRRQQLEMRLLNVLNELERRQYISTNYALGMLLFADQTKQIREYIELVGEYGIAYESLVATIEMFPFVLSGKAAIALLELGLLLGFKTERMEDSVFDRRKRAE